MTASSMTPAAHWERGTHEIGVLRVSGAAVTASPISREEADALAPAFAAIEPWAVYRYPTLSLADYFGTVEPGAPRFALRVGAQVAGVLGLRVVWLKGPYVQFLGILPSFQSEGVGSAVMGWLGREAAERFGPNLWVCASEFNTGALAFYERQGFQRVVLLDGLVRDGFEEVLLRRRLHRETENL